MAELLPGADPFSSDGGPAGVLVLHGLTGTPQSVRGWAEALASAGFTVRLPLLPGHGTSVDDLERTGWADWVTAAKAEYRELSAACEHVVLAGLSMGGSLACRLAADHPADVRGLVAVNPFIDPPAESFRATLREILDADIARAPGIAGDVADPDAHEKGYDELPVAPLLSLCEGLVDLQRRLPAIVCPVLVMTSRVDHVVPPVSSDVLAERVRGPVERVTLERSYHVATLDHDRQEVERRSVEFARRVTGGAPYDRVHGRAPVP